VADGPVANDRGANDRGANGPVAKGAVASEVFLGLELQKVDHCIFIRYLNGIQTGEIICVQRTANQHDYVQSIASGLAGPPSQFFPKKYRVIAVLQVLRAYQASWGSRI